MVDVFAGSADTDYNKLDWSLSQSLAFHPSLSTRQLICLSPLTQASKETLRTVSSGAMYALILFINNFTRIDYAAQPNSSTRSFSTPSSIIRNIPHSSSNSAWHWWTTANWVLRSSLSQRTSCRQRSAGSSSQTSWTDVSEFLDSHRGAWEEVQSCRRTDITASGSKWFVG